MIVCFSLFALGILPPWCWITPFTEAYTFGLVLPPPRLLAHLALMQ